ncbi:MAG: hypothetical protein C0602_00510 [Denitrovibrio sp.]|nr:MAG: hypothetical protein C0602_00510 [Denitrovibrio sp.]
MSYVRCESDGSCYLVSAGANERPSDVAGVNSEVVERIQYYSSLSNKEDKELEKQKLDQKSRDK